MKDQDWTLVAAILLIGMPLVVTGGIVILGILKMLEVIR
ncbi:hypothetical protein LCGC14_2052680 [marine sediment metagenome]|uniref:Uncharacterized protein n=1 Tax=marine sediment metagenome TaxID=412755 RepID=A0A0F9H201_9ZZZZ